MKLKASRLLVLVTAMSMWCAVGYADNADNRTVVGVDPDLSNGALAIRMGSYEEGIRLTERGLKGAHSKRDRAAGLSNLCAAYVGLEQPDPAIELCSQSLAINSNNWRTYSNRAAAFTIKGLYSEALFDLDAAAAINPDARNVEVLRQILNERRLRPKVIMEDHQPTGLFSE